jgi:hypothetical protein
MEKHGFIVRVTRERLGGGASDVSLYAVAADAPMKAETIVRDTIKTLDEKIEAVGPVRWDVLTDQLGLKEGEFTHL